MRSVNWNSLLMGSLGAVGLIVVGQLVAQPANGQPAPAAMTAAPTKAVAVVHALGDTKTAGKVTFTKVDGGIKIEADITGLTPGKHGFHVHEFGDCSMMDGTCAGGHFNPDGKPHGGPDSAERHVGELRLSDIATITRGYADPPQPKFRVNGKDAIGVALSMRTGGDILALEKNLDHVMEELKADLPVGIETFLVSNQPKVVEEAVDEFMKALWEAIAIVLVISFLNLGLRAGMVVAASIPLVLAIVFIVMQIFGIDLQRISLGALIIALGLLVDDAMITIETMVSKVEHGWDTIKAAIFAYASTAYPRLTGTLVIALGFVPVGFAKSSAGEYTFSLFAVVVIAVLTSWFVAALFHPLIGTMLLKPPKHEGKGPPRGWRAPPQLFIGACCSSPCVTPK